MDITIKPEVLSAPNSFIVHVNLLVRKLYLLIELNSKFSTETIETLLDLSELELQVLIDDLKKGDLSVLTILSDNIEKLFELLDVYEELEQYHDILAQVKEALIVIVEEANRAGSEANRAEQEADRARDEADKALGIIQEAETQANRARDEANRAQEIVDNAVGTLEETVSDGVTTIGNAVDTGLEILNEAAETERQSLEGIAAGVSGEVERATEEADRAGNEADRAESEANRAKDEIDKILEDLLNNLPIATIISPGFVQPDGVSIKITPEGVISVDSQNLGGGTVQTVNEIEPDSNKDVNTLQIVSESEFANIVTQATQIPRRIYVRPEAEGGSGNGSNGDGIQSVDGIEPLGDSRNVQLRYVMTKAQFDALGSNPPAGRYLITDSGGGHTSVVSSITVIHPLSINETSGDVELSILPATITTAGFMSAVDKSKLDGIATGATVGVPSVRTISTSAPLTGGGSLESDRVLGISVATQSTAGSMSASDKLKLDNIDLRGFTFSHGTSVPTSLNVNEVYFQYET